LRSNSIASRANIRWRVLSIALPVVLSAWLIAAAMAPVDITARAGNSTVVPTRVDSTIRHTPMFLIIEPPPSDEYFPCSDCHLAEDEVDRTVRVLEDEHEDKQLKHGGGALWCLDCHDATNRDQLHSASGSGLNFEQSYKLCRQCHGEIFQEWKVGVHGKRIGSWSGAKQYYVCKHCHDPHSPVFKPIKPMPPPVRPKDIK